jgi:hypothetical protein
MLVDRLVGLPETDEVGCDHAIAAGNADGDHVAIQI